jgi:hypothetical protein
MSENTCCYELVLLLTKKPHQLVGLLLFAEGRLILFVHFYYKYEVLQALHLLRAGRPG